ncbi:MAG TPA: hypothetical protein VGS23_07840 [Thermoplasmata archaeon]|nr:hypothetical protein [Thermoplasmata archaeon]
MAANAETMAASSRVERYARYVDLVDSLVPPSNSSWYNPPAMPLPNEPSHRMRQRDFERRIRALNGGRP